MINKLKRSIPISFMQNDTLVLYKFGTIYLYNLQNNRKEKVGQFPFSFRQNILSRVKLLSRAMRLDVRYGIAVNDEELILIRDKYFYLLNIRTKTVSKKYPVAKGSRPLNITLINNIEGFDDGIYYGEYFGNGNKDEGSIRKIKNDFSGDTICYTFEKGKINHIHNIIPDQKNKCVWISTGDFGEGAGIWRANNNFKTVTPVLVGKQEYRSCVAFPTEEGLLYATDTPFELNSIRLLFQDKSEWKTKKISDIKGASIYGCKFNDKYVFSTSVEPNGFNTSLWQLLFGRTKGDGILDYYSHVYLGDLKNGFEEILQTKKDRFPFIPFQFGVVVFPTGHLFGKKLPFYNIATKKDDLNTTIIDTIN